MQHECLKCHVTVELPSGHKFNVCPTCGAVQEKFATTKGSHTIAERTKVPPPLPKEKTSQPLRPIAEKSLPLAIGLNLLIPGAGYAYMGRVGLGFAVLGLLIMGGVAGGASLFVGAWFVFNIVMALDMLILHGKHAKAQESALAKACPECAETIKLDAKVCRFCGAKCA